MPVRHLSSAARFRPIVYVISAVATTRAICEGVLAARFAGSLDVRGFDRLDAGLAALERVRPALVLADWRFDAADARPILARALSSGAEVPTIVMVEPRDATRPGRLEDLGAIDTLWLPLRPQRVGDACSAVFELTQARVRARAAMAPALALVG